MNVILVIVIGERMNKKKNNPIESPQKWTTNSEGADEFIGSWIDNKTFAKLVAHDLDYFAMHDRSDILREIIKLQFGSRLNHFEYIDAYTELVREMDFNVDKYLIAWGDHTWINNFSPKEYFSAIFQLNPKYKNLLKQALENFFNSNYIVVSIPHAKSFSYNASEFRPIHSIEETQHRLYNPTGFLDHPIHKLDHTDKDTLDEIGFRLCRTTRDTK